MTSIPEKIEPVEKNAKALTAKCIFNITIRDEPHFYKVVNWLNTNVGRGADKWTMEGRVKRLLLTGKPVTRRVFVYVDDFDEASSLYLKLI